MTDHVIQRYRLMETQVIGPSIESARHYAKRWSTKPAMAMALDPDEEGIPEVIWINGVAFRRADSGEGEE
jgi:hypothetical protein